MCAKAKKLTLPFIIPTVDLARAMKEVDEAITLALDQLNAAMHEHGITTIKLTEPVDYTDPDAEHPAVDSIRLNEDGLVEAVDDADIDLVFLLSNMEPATVLAILEHLPAMK